MTLTQGCGYGINKMLFFLHDKVRITNLIPTKLSRYIPLVMHITLLDIGIILLETFLFFGIFFSKFRLWSFKVRHFSDHISGMVCSIDLKHKGSASVRYWINYVTLRFDLIHDLNIGFFKLKFLNSCISGIIGLIDVK